MRRAFKPLLGAIVGAVLVLGLAGCAVNPATGRPTFTAFMSAADEIRIGREEHPKILDEFGGAYHDPAIRRYLSQIGGELGRVAGKPNLPFTFTVLNSDIVNAFALPGGYVYVTAGLMALANNEAELAGVVAHEIGHIAARHTAERYSTALAAQIGLNVLGVLTGDRLLGQGAELGATLALSSFSREQESEADMLGIRYMTRLGYDPMAMATFLKSLEAENALQAKLAGRPGAADRFSLFSTHPRTAERVAEAVGLARAQMASAAELRLGAGAYLSRIDGMYYGGDPENGFVKGRLFIHPRMGFRFQVPPGFQLFNGRSRIVAIGPDRARIVFDVAPKPVPGSMAHYLRNVWAPGRRLAAVETIGVNGLEGATGATRVSTQEGPVDLRLVAIRRDPSTIYRFAFLTPPKLSAALSEELRRTTYSFRLLTEREARVLRPLRIRVKAVEPGDTVASLAAGMRFEDHRIARFRTLNGLAPGQPLRVGQLVKIVVEE